MKRVATTTIGRKVVTVARTEIVARRLSGVPVAPFDRKRQFVARVNGSWVEARNGAPRKFVTAAAAFAAAVNA